MKLNKRMCCFVPNTICRRSNGRCGGALYTFVSQTAKGWQPVLLGTNCQPFFVAYTAHRGTLCARKAGRNRPTQLPSAAQRYNTLDFVTKVVCHETLARFLWILPAQRAGRPLMTILSILLQDGLAKRGPHPLINSRSQREVFGIFIKPKTALHSDAELSFLIWDIYRHIFQTTL